MWGPLELDLFASRLTFQLPQFVSWRPDPLATYRNAFSLNWKDLGGYAFPPFALISRCLHQIFAQEVTQLVLVAPVWETQPWYPLLLELCVDLPLLLPGTPDLLTREDQMHPLPNLLLAGWLLSASIIRKESFSQET